MLSPKPPPPSGPQVEIVSGTQRAVITGVGGSLRLYEVDGRSVVDGYRIDEMASGGRGQLLIPWPNRIGDGRYQFRGSDYQLPLSDPSRLNANHGLVRWSTWALEQTQPNGATARYHLFPQPGYPFSLELEVEYQLSERGLRVRIVATNVGATAAPYGAGQHPFVQVGTELIDDAILRIPAGSTLPTDRRGLPSGAAVPVDDTDLDFRQPHPIGPTVLDTCYCDIDRDADGVVRVVLSHPSGRPSVTVWGDSSVAYLMVFTGDTLTADRRRRSVAIEPMTCPPNAFVTGSDVMVLEPGQQTTTSWGITQPGPSDTHTG